MAVACSRAAKLFFPKKPLVRPVRRFARGGMEGQEAQHTEQSGGGAECKLEKVEVESDSNLYCKFAIAHQLQKGGYGRLRTVITSCIIFLFN